MQSPLEKAFKEKLRPFVKSQEQKPVPHFEMMHHSDERDENLEFGINDDILVTRDIAPVGITKQERKSIRYAAPNPEEGEHGLHIELIPTIKIEGPPHKQHGAEPVKQVHPSR